MSKMKKCPHCAEEIEENAVKCPYCFESLETQNDTPLEDQKVELYSPKLLFVLGLFLPMVFCADCISQNWKFLGNPDAARKHKVRRWTIPLIDFLMFLVVVVDAFNPDGGIARTGSGAGII